MFCLLAPASALEYRARHPDDRTPEWTTDGCTNVDFLQAVVARNLEPWLAARDRFSESYVRSRIDETLMRNEAELKKARGSQEPTGLDGLSETNSQIVSFLVHKGALYLHAPLRQTNRFAYARIADPRAAQQLLVGLRRHTRSLPDAGQALSAGHAL